ncbi:MAG: site-specific integrase [Bacteroidota bacterium]
MYKKDILTRNDQFNEKKNHLGIQFYPRKSKSKGYVVIYCHISLNQKRTKSPFTTHVKLPESSWDREYKIIIEQGFEKEENDLRRIKSIIYEIHLRLDNRGEPYDAEMIKSIYLSDIYLKHDVKEKYKIKEVSTLYYKSYKKNLLYTDGTKKRVKHYHNKILNYFGLLEAEKLERYHIDNFYKNLITYHNNSHNVAIRNIEFLKGALKNAFEKGHLSFYPCNDYKTKRIRTHKKSYLTQEELNKLISAKFMNRRYNSIRDIFVFCCYTGMDYSSYLTFKKDFIKQKNKEEYIDYNRVKNGLKALIPYFSTAKIIAEAYDYQLPYFVNQNYNKLIKEVCYLAGIDENKCRSISTHSARVTAGMLWLNAGIRIEVVSKMLGHASTETTQRYYAEIELETVLKESEKIA